MSSPLDSTVAVVAVIGGIVAILGGILALVSYFATRREVDTLQDRMDKFETVSETRTKDLHKRINRVSSCVDRIAGKLGVHVPAPDIYHDE